MKRMHIHVGVENIEQSIQFYNSLFGEEPAKVKDDYAKWMLEDPRINFAISTRAEQQGVNHLGLQVDHLEELEDIRARVKEGGIETFDDGETVCCYSRSEKTWVNDPSGVAWETYQTMDDAQVYTESDQSTDSECCVPEMNETSSGDTKSHCCG